MKVNNVFKRLLLLVTLVLVFVGGLAPLTRAVSAEPGDIEDGDYFDRDFNYIICGVEFRTSDEDKIPTASELGQMVRHKDTNGSDVDYSVSFMGFQGQFIMSDTATTNNNNTNYLSFPEIDGLVKEVLIEPSTTPATHDPAKSYRVLYRDPISLTITKKWEDDNDAKQIRPGSITITLKDKAGNAPDIENIEITADNDWEVVLTEEQGLRPGVDYYIVENDVPAGYKFENTSETTYPSANTTNTTITNTTVPTANIVVKKVWEDENNKYRARPSSVKLTLIDPDDPDNPVEVELSADNWQVTLPEDCGLKSGVEYTVEEEFPVDYSVSNYTNSVSTSTVDNVTTITVTNKIVTETKALALKIWNDGLDKHGVRPQADEIKDNLVLYANRSEEPYLTRLGSISELEEMGYQVDIITENVEEYIVENNLLKPDKTDNWYGDEAWLIVFNGLDKYYWSNHWPLYMPFLYQVDEEIEVDNYIMKKLLYNEGTSMYVYNASKITNATAQGELVLDATKVLDGKKLEENEFEFILKDEEGNEIKAKNTADGSVTFESIHLEMNDLERISYFEATEDQKNNIKFWVLRDTFLDSEINEGRLFLVDPELMPPNATNQRVVRGKTYSETTWEEKKQAIEDRKGNLSVNIWQYNGNNYIDSKMFEYACELDESVFENFVNSFDVTGYTKEMSFTIEEVIGNEEGVTYDDHVANIKVIACYDGSPDLAFDIKMEEDDDNVFTNTYRTDISVDGIKSWVDEDDKDQLRPESIIVNLLADGEPALDKDGEPITITVTEEDDWMFEFTDLPKYKDGVEIEYTIEEEEVEGYDTTIEGDMEEGFIITNIHVPYEEPKKEVNGEAEIDIKNRNNEFTYTITALIPSKTEKFKIVDPMPEPLEIISAEFSVEGVEVDIDGQTITVEINDKELLYELTGQTVELTIVSKIKSSISNDELMNKYGKKGIINEAEITIGNKGRKIKDATVIPDVPTNPTPKYDIPKTGVE